MINLVLVKAAFKAAAQSAGLQACAMTVYEGCLSVDHEGLRYYKPGLADAVNFQHISLHHSSPKCLAVQH